MTLPRDNVRKSARTALLQMFEPLTGFVIDAGLSARDLQILLREAVVKSVAKRQLDVSRRINISGIAATTGIPRAEISRILKRGRSQGSRVHSERQQSTNRILAAWHDEPRFTNANGQPADLKLYGRGATFESLVKTYGRGIPPRAVLDELVRSRVVVVLPSQRVRAKASLAVHRGLNTYVIKEFGQRASDLLSTMLANIREPDNPRFLATVSGRVASKKALPLIRRELSNRSAEFLAEVQDTVVAESRKPSKRATGTVGVTVFYHEVDGDKPGIPESKRTNFRRHV